MSKSIWLICLLLGLNAFAAESGFVAEAHYQLSLKGERFVRVLPDGEVVNIRRFSSGNETVTPLAKLEPGALAALQAEIESVSFCLETEGNDCYPALFKLSSGAQGCADDAEITYQARQSKGRVVTVATEGHCGEAWALAGNRGEKVVQVLKGLAALAR